MSRREPMWTCGARAASLVLLALLAGCARERGAPRPGPDCEVARVGDDVVTVADADVLRAVIQPPLTRDEAKRLAVSATAAYRRQHPEGSMAPMDERLAAHRRAVREKTELEASNVQPGECWAGPSAR